MRQRRIRQANLMGPAGLVSVDDSEVIALSQEGAEVFPDADRFWKWAADRRPIPTT